MITHSGQILIVDRELLKRLLFNSDGRLFDAHRRRQALLDHFRERLKHERTGRSAASWDWEHDLPVIIDEIEHEVDKKALTQITTQISTYKHRQAAQVEVFASAVNVVLHYLNKALASGQAASATADAAGESPEPSTRPLPITQVLEKKILLLAQLCLPTG